MTPPEPVEAQCPTCLRGLQPEYVPVRLNTGGVLPDGTTNHPPIDFASAPPEPVEARELTVEDIEDNRLADAIAAEWSGRPEVRSIATSEGLIYVVGPLRAEAARPSEGLEARLESIPRWVEGMDATGGQWVRWDAVRAALDQPRSGEAAPEES